MRNILLKQVVKDERYKYIERTNLDAVEFKTDNTLIYFFNSLTSRVYTNDKGNQNE